MKKPLLSFAAILFSISMIGLNVLAQLPEAIGLTPLNSDGRSPVTLTFNPNLACDNGAKTLVGAVKVQMHSSIHTANIPMSGWGIYGIDYNAVPKDGIHTTTDLTDNGDGTYSITFTPSDFYGVPADSVIIGLSLVFNNGTWDKEGKDKDGANCKDFKVLFSNSNSVKSLQTSNRFTFSPNPVTDIMRINAAESIETVVVSDILGKEVLRIPGNQNLNMVVNTESLSKGIYIVSVYDKKGLAGNSKLLKQ
ncbi:MAG: T9SS type A sorting domain-containing protein [Bacteroidales bacterium]|nr:T9SS type A sorting domain-containing protein [Bacteroidales bacterium]MCB9013525.1 T9SS type A sorting domain-containing protein [Bacteroidales bacterium]